MEEHEEEVEKLMTGLRGAREEQGEDAGWGMQKETTSMSSPTTMSFRSFNRFGHSAGTHCISAAVCWRARGEQGGG